MKKHDFTAELPALLHKLEGLASLMIGLRGISLLEIKGLQGLGSILMEIHCELREMHDNLYGHEDS